MERYKVVEKESGDAVYVYAYSFKNAEAWIENFDNKYYVDKSLTKDSFEIVKVED